MQKSQFENLKRYNHLLGEMEATYHAAALHFGLSDSVEMVLYTFCNFGDSCPLNDFSRYTGLTKQTLHSAMVKLAEQGMITLEAVNGKAKRVCLTDAGRELASRTSKKIFDIENEIFASWSDEDVQKYVQLTERFLDALREKVAHL